jgi:hypothetical protein
MEEAAQRRTTPLCRRLPERRVALTGKRTRTAQNTPSICGWRDMRADRRRLRADRGEPSAQRALLRAQTGRRSCLSYFPQNATPVVCAV